jgi:hypothetical protein
LFFRFASISIAWYFIRGRKDFTGPPVVPNADPTLKGEPAYDGSDESFGEDVEAKAASKIR